MDNNNPTSNLDQLRAKTASSLGDVKQDVKSAANDVRAAASNGAHALKSDMQQLLESAKASGKIELGAAADRLSSYLDSIATSATELQQKGRERVKLAAETTDTYVHDNPWQSVAIGAGVGAALGFALGCMSTRR